MRSSRTKNFRQKFVKLPQRVKETARKNIEHRLKIDYVPLPECRNKGKAEVIAFKKNMKRKLAPSMKPKLEKEFSEIYQDAVDIVEAEYEIDLPQQCPYSLTDLLP